MDIPGGQIKQTLCSVFHLTDANTNRHSDVFLRITEITAASEETLICAKFGKDLLNIYKVIGRKKVAQFF